MKKDGIVLSVGFKMFDENSQSLIGDLEEFSVTGVVVEKSGGIEKLYVSNQVFERLWNEQKVNIEYYSVVETDYKEDKNAVYSIAFLPYDSSDEQTDIYWNMYHDETFAEDGTRISPIGAFVDKVALIDEMVQSLSTVFLYVGIVFAVFASLLLSNFISVSISQKKKEIGILRAVGARSLDVFKIFFSESFFISVICVVLAAAASGIVCNLLNMEVTLDLGASIFVFGWKSLLVLIGIALATTVIATFLPVWNAAKKKPVDSIRAL